jgi:ATP-binding cassette subfamily B protein
MNRISEDVSKENVGPAVMYSINTIIRFTIVIVYMYNVSPRLTLYTILPLPLLSYGIFKLSSEINKRSTVFQYLSKIEFLPRNIFRYPSNQGLFTRRPAPKQHGVIKESKSKSLNLPKYSLYSVR